MSTIVYLIPALSSSFLVNLHCVQAGFEYSVTVIFLLLVLVCFGVRDLTVDYFPFGVGCFWGSGFGVIRCAGGWQNLSDIIHISWSKYGFLAARYMPSRANMLF